MHANGALLGQTTGLLLLMLGMHYHGQVADQSEEQPTYHHDKMGSNGNCWVTLWERQPSTNSIYYSKLPSEYKREA